MVGVFVVIALDVVITHAEPGNRRAAGEKKRRAAGDETGCGVSPPFSIPETVSTVGSRNAMMPVTT